MTPLLETLISLFLVILGAAVTLVALRSAVVTFVLPRSAQDVITRFVFRRTRLLFAIMMRVRHANTYEQRDAIMALYAPVALLFMPSALLIVIQIGFTLMYIGMGVRDPVQAFELSGSSMLTLGIVTWPVFGVQMFIYLEAIIGLVMVALLISYIPAIYSAFSKREAAVAMLETRAGSPPSPADLFIRFHRLGRLDKIHDLWEQWEQWFAELDETHTSLAVLSFFRSPQSNRSWVTAAGAVLDAAALQASTLDVPRDVNAEVSIRAGYVALRHIADYFGIAYDPNPNPTDAISISRAEYDDVVNQLEMEGVPLKEDREQAWRDFSGWRVNYDTVLLALAALTMAPYAQWSSDRSFLRVRGGHSPFRTKILAKKALKNLPASSKDSPHKP